MPSATWPIHVDPSHLYFITTSVNHNLHILKNDVLKRIVIDSLNAGRILGHYQLYAFVIMPNHIHFIIKCFEKYSPQSAIRELKKATALLILRQLKAENKQEVLSSLCITNPKSASHNYAIWKPEYQAQNIFSPSYLKQKLEYIHYNPTREQWKLVENPEDYIWSSARFYMKDKPALIPLSDARDFL